MTIPDATGAADAAVGDPAAALRADVEAIVALERMIRAAQAEQLRLIRTAHGYAHAVEGVHDGSPAGEREFATRAFIAEVATALVIPEASASGLVADAGVAGRHPATLTSLATGSIGLPQARSIFDAVIGLPAAAAAALEEAALERAPSQTNAALRRRLRTLRERLHPEPLDTRHRVAVAERRVVIEPAPDGMAWLSLFMDAERAHAIKHRLDTIAATTPTAETAADAADTARRLAAHAPSFQRILTHPETGAYLSYGRTRYRVPADLAGYLRVRDGTCRFPGCNRRAEGCDLDHTTDWAHGGTTCAANIAGSAANITA